MLTSRVALLSSGLDPEVASYAAAISANGGSVSQTWLRNVNTFVRGCKGDGIWDSLLDVGLLCGVDNLSGALVKLKTPSGVSRTLTNNNFVSGDYTASGATAGLKGNATSKFLDTGTVASSFLSLGSASISAYASGFSAEAGTYRTFVGASNAGAAALVDIGLSNTNRVRGQISRNGTSYVWSESSTLPESAFCVTSATSTSDLRVYLNGQQSGSTLTTTRNEAITTRSIYILTSNNGGTPAAYSSVRISFYHIGIGLSASQVLALSNRVNALMAAIGANQY